MQCLRFIVWKWPALKTATTTTINATLNIEFRFDFICRPSATADRIQCNRLVPFFSNILAAVQFSLLLQFESQCAHNGKKTHKSRRRNQNHWFPIISVKCQFTWMQKCAHIMWTFELGSIHHQVVNHKKDHFKNIIHNSNQRKEGTDKKKDWSAVAFVNNINYSKVTNKTKD